MLGYNPPNPLYPPAEDDTPRERLTEQEVVYAWRLISIMSAGADLEEAIKLALSKGETHRICDALVAGCKPSTAVLIFE